MESVVLAPDNISLQSDRPKDFSPTVREREYLANEPIDIETRFATSASNLRRAHTVAQGRNIAKSNIGVKAVRGRVATSILRAKDSHEVLKKRPVKRFDIPQARVMRLQVRGNRITSQLEMSGRMARSFSGMVGAGAQVSRSLGETTK
ncbi:uncharacterized protein P174DRAFT_436306 [Aspergillus novofumigatus IBT 16806]|uniref:Uncharacterized protein n=1 Tax=Aspergillus novofumigatus (strain IBT 16806) TaxID=1392255 RepID=A0A2I1BSD2_ASPN1|nr:uncharacterized protein P174DRAFT_436306 [Aspergillus novofumigatus IBT 16806]PKX88201.1 hypothetical protein P174DRAFT_436306 [Aspergillus novofumigatus IBT 16806]